MGKCFRVAVQGCTVGIRRWQPMASTVLQGIGMLHRLRWRDTEYDAAFSDDSHLPDGHNQLVPPLGFARVPEVCTSAHPLVFDLRGPRRTLDAYSCSLCDPRPLIISGPSRNFNERLAADAVHQGSTM